MTDFKKIINEISFSGLSPLDPGLLLLCGQTHNPMLTKADMCITKLPYKNDFYRQLFEPLCMMPRMCTFAIGFLINQLVTALPDDQSFCNVGVWHGFPFLSGIINNPTKPCVGVDNFSQFGGPKNQFISRFNQYKSEHHIFFDLDYRDYFALKHTGEIGFYIYDGNHKSEHQFEGLRIAEPHLAKGAYILIDDINDDGPIEGTLQFIKESAHSYQILFEQHTAHNSHPTFWNGVALLQKLS